MSVHLALRPGDRGQTIEGFGASGAWWAQVVGGWPDETRTRIMELLYSKTKGLGMTTYRYNLGGGSKESGRGNIGNPNRRASSFLREDGGYDWGRDAQAVWCMEEAVRQGADDIILFVNSPPERWTVSGAAHCKTPLRSNLLRAHERDFVGYVLDVAEHFAGQGVPVISVSPINEPQWIWTGGQEGCHYKPWNLRRVFSLLAQEMEKRPALRDVKISGPECGDLRFFNKTYIRAMMRDPQVRRRLAGIDTHSYRVFQPQLFPGAAARYRRWASRKYPGVPLHVSEWTHMRGPRDYGMDSALEQCRVMMQDLGVLGVVSWQHWVAVSEVDYADGLIYIDEEARTFDIPKRYYAFGNFTKFVPRGSVRVGIECSAPRLEAIAFRTPEGKTVVILRNPREEEQVSLGQNGGAVLHVTDDTRDLAPVPVALEGFALPGRSVCTLIF